MNTVKGKMHNRNPLGKILVAVALCAVSGVASASSQRAWIGQGDGSSWHDPLNWRPNGVPTADDALEFNFSATVKLDRNGAATCWSIVVNGGEVRIETDLAAETGIFLTKDDYEGPYLAMMSDTTGADVNGWNVKPGAKLDIAVPTWCENRTDKWYGGELWFHAPLRLKKVSYFGYGTNCFARGANVYSDLNFVVGLGKSSTGIRDCVIFKDNAIFNGAMMRFCGSTDCTSNTLEIDGDDVVVDVNQFNLNPQSTAGEQYLVVKRGKMKVNTNFYTEQNASVKPGHVLVTGGQLIVVPTLASYVGTVRVEGGTLELRTGIGGFFGDTYLDFAGGELHLKYLSTASDHNFRLGEKIHVTGENCVFNIPQNGVFHWDFDHAVIGAETKIRKTGAGDIRFSRSEAVFRPLEVLGGYATIASGVTLTAPSGTDGAWDVMLGDGAEFRFTDITSRLSVPVNAELVGTGKFTFPVGSVTARGLVVARSLTTNGVQVAKGRYVSASGIVSGSTGASLVVPYRWTGAGDGTRFADAANWEGRVVPPSGTNTAIDLSLATHVVIDGDYTLTSIVYLPTGANRKATLSVDGTLTLNSDEWYSCATYVLEDSRLALDVDVLQRGDTRGDMSMIGGGTVSVKGDFPGLLWTNGELNYIPFSIDGSLAFDGASHVYKGNINPYDFPFMMLWTHEIAGRGKVRIENGANISAMRLFVGDDRFNTLDEIRQTGGTATFDSIYLEKTVADAGRASYFLEGGTLNVNGTFGLCYSYNSKINPLRRPGPSFTMTGGVWNQNGPLYLRGNQNRVKVLGGTANGAGTWEYSTAGGECAVLEPNDDHFHFGGATLRASTAELRIKGNIVLTGVGGDTILDADSNSVGLGYWGYDIVGSGGVVMNGTKAVLLDGRLQFTGGITVNNTSRAYIGNGVNTESLDGPRFIKVNNASCIATVRPPVLKSPEVISLKAAGTLTCTELANGTEFHVKRYIIDGVDQPVGRYAITGGTIVVDTPASSWLDGDSGDLTYAGDSVMTAATTLSKLRYAPFEEGQTATLSGTQPLTFDDGAVIEVTEGQTLVITAPVAFAGAVRKIGFGKVVFAAAVGGSSSLAVEQGEAEFSGTLAGVTVTAARNAYGNEPVVTLGDGVTLNNTATLDIGDGAHLVLDGTINFEQADQADVQTFDLPYAGTAVAVQKGVGTLAWTSTTAPADLRVESGTVQIGTVSTDFSETSLTVTGNAIVDIPTAEVVAVKSAYLNTQPVKAGDYAPGFRRMGAHVSGAGTLRVLTGDGPGTSMTFR